MLLEVGGLFGDSMFCLVIRCFVCWLNVLFGDRMFYLVTGVLFAGWIFCLVTVVLIADWTFCLVIGRESKNSARMNFA